MLVWCGALCACGYAVVRGDALPGGAGALRVAAVDNRTAAAEAGGWVASAARDALASRGQLAREDAAAPVWELTLSSLRVAPSALGASGAAAFRVEALLGAKVVSGGAALFADTLAGGEDYPVGVDVTESDANRRAAVQRLLRRLVAEGLDRMAVAAAASPPR